MSENDMDTFGAMSALCIPGEQEKEEILEKNLASCDVYWPTCIAASDAS
jgi:hypothetical protein